VRRSAATGAALATMLLVAACGSSGPTPPSSASPAPRSAAPALASPTACNLPVGAAPTALDPGLLSVLPARVGGVAVAQEPDSFSQAMADPCFAANVDRAVFAIAVSGDDLASGVVAHLRPGVYSDAMFADWRSSYDDGACAQAGGVVGHAQQTLALRTTYVTTCGGGLRVYHAYLPGKGAIVSLFSTGPNDFGAQLVSGIAG